MTNVSNPAPGSPWTPERVRILKIAVAIMTTLLILGIVALVYGVARQATKLGSASSAPSLPAQSLYGRDLALGQGELKSVSASDGLIVLYWKGEASDTIVTIEGRNGRELGRIQVPHR
jgi:hypothetical protein